MFWCTLLPAADLNNQVISPQDKRIYAKIMAVENYGQQLFISYNAGKDYERITWFQQKGQVFNCLWSQHGLLAIEVHHVNYDYKISKNYVHFAADLASVGVFDPSAKVIYWLDGMLAKNKAVSDDASKIKWQNQNTLEYRAIRLSQCDSADEIRTVVVNSNFLNKQTKDLSPQISRFGHGFLAAVKAKKDLTYYFKMIKKEDTVKLKKYLKSTSPEIINSFEICLTESLRGGYYYLTLNSSVEKFKQNKKKKLIIYNFFFEYDPKTTKYSFSVLEPDI